MSVAGLAPRRLAGDVIAGVLKSRAALDEALEQSFRTSPGADLDERDRALVGAIAVSAFRRLGTIREAIAHRLPRGLPRRGETLEMLLIVGAAQILLLDIPDHAAVDAAVELAKESPRLASFRGLINAVLRRISSERDSILAGADPLKTDTPAWLRHRWVGAYGAELAQSIAGAHRREPAIDITVKSDQALWAERLDGLVLPTGSIRLRGKTRIPSLAGYAEGAWWVQDAAAALPVRLLRPKPGERIADLCAAPGGKTAQLAAAGADVLAVDRSAPRLERLKANMARLGLEVAVRLSDALALEEAPFDAVLLDAPCTATGTIRRHPDVAWTKREDDLAKLAGLQMRLLDKSVALLKPGGRLVFSTCSLEPEEGEEQVERLLGRSPLLRRMPVEPHEIGGLAEAVTPKGDLRVLPSMMALPDGHLSGVDGFFVGRLVRQA